jgi:hypothetical protein
MSEPTKEAIRQLIRDCGWSWGYGEVDEGNVMRIQAFLDQAVAEEREACAKVAEQFYDDGEDAASAIRARDSKA